MWFQFREVWRGFFAGMCMCCLSVAGGLHSGGAGSQGSSEKRHADVTQNEPCLALTESSTNYLMAIEPCLACAWH